MPLLHFRTPKIFPHVARCVHTVTRGRLFLSTVSLNGCFNYSNLHFHVFSELKQAISEELAQVYKKQIVGAICFFPA